jgi:hypothetical protein
MQAWIGLTVADVLEACGTPYAEVSLFDDPPGKLRAVEFDCRQGRSPRHTVLVLRYHHGLFDIGRAWSRALVEAQVVERVLDSARDLA